MNATETLETVRAAVEPVVAEHGASLYDVEIAGTGAQRVVRVLIDRDGGVDLDTVERVSRALDGVVDDLLPGAFLLEVSSPGLERPLRRPEHFARVLGALVSVKYRDGDGRSLRSRATLVGVDEEAGTATFDEDGRALVIALDAITAANTVFEWGAAAPPGRARDNGGSSRSGGRAGRSRGTKEQRR